MQEPHRAPTAEDRATRPAPTFSDPSGQPAPIAAHSRVRSLACAWVIAACWLGAPGAAHAISDKDCQRPLPPEVPQAATASEVDMISTRVRINMYVEAANSYIECLDEAFATIGETGREVKEKRIQTKRDEIQAEMVEVAESYNAQVAVYRERLAREQGGDDAESSGANDGAGDAQPAEGSPGASTPQRPVASEPPRTNEP